MSLRLPSDPPAGGLDALEGLASALDDPRPHPTEPALRQLGEGLMSEVLDLVLGTALEDHLTAICETLVGGVHAGVQRIEREADRARQELAGLLRDFDGSEVADQDLQAARARADAADVAVRALETVRDAAAEAYARETGEAWSPWRGIVRGRATTAAQVMAEAALRAQAARRTAEADPGDQVVAFRASPKAKGAQDARRIFDALNWARGQWPQMSLAITEAAGGERLAKRWAQQKGVRLVLARPDFERHGRSAPFRANDALMALRPVCVLTLAASLEATDERPFGPALNLAQQARAKGVRCVRVRDGATA